MIRRLAHVALAFLIVLDIGLCFAWLAPLYLVGGERWASRPNGRQMISAYVGRARINGHRWAYRAGLAIDWVFAKLGDGPSHCERMALRYAGFAD